jgi:hypothetical protein
MPSSGTGGWLNLYSEDMFILGIVTAGAARCARDATRLKILPERSIVKNGAMVED